MKFDYKRLIKFEYNLGTKEKKIRMYAGLGLLFVSLFLGSVLMLLVGGVLVATSFFGWCPAYSGFCHSSNTEGGACGAKEATPKAEAPKADSE